MDQLANSSHFLDLAGLDNLRAKAQTDQKAALKEVARQFEGIFVQMLMKSMRDANQAFEADSPLNSQYTKFYEQMHDQQLSVDLSKKGMLGLADLMVQQLDPQHSGITPASVMRSDSAMAFVAPRGAGVTPAAAPATDDSADAPYAPLPLENPAAVNGPLTAADATAASNGHRHDARLPMSDYDTLDSILSGQVLPQDAGNIGSPEDFVKVLYPYAKEAAAQLGTSAEVLLAQSALETGWGQKMIKTSDGRPSNNLFNIKADKRWQGGSTTVGTTEYEQGRAVRENAAFRVYDNLKDSFNDYVALISQSERYQHARQVAAEPAQYVRGLAQAGYATDPQYANKVMRVLQSIKQDFGQFLQGAGGR
ncbi:flagellar assembly peptidoglycan hydrolase FlgJ [Shewanella sp. YIC-542]|uniref:flagellar assembly peptidoglycan hydrolase FlgJ n=1 Tax=Shewanella mytili TaxID=3377111 RepID=UPI00398E6E43